MDNSGLAATGDQNGLIKLRIAFYRLDDSIIELRVVEFLSGSLVDGNLPLAERIHILQGMIGIL